ncbi:uncharacterized protein F4822DRAFT_296614 [Hypoxylon trugodes]|uniref:uncharacterized protein n=1 Tax=Hypoxylon trugodes TaxID=326681 RepID=UPI00219A3F21|nr:uncharacterized protein F4822DRAFT_296614 [Hypoxylon trugodes]KAI1387943.1 hypothetical protein F4822DRAFT_296614 [Hypoxylon trugodes]
MADARALLRAHRAENRIKHPHAAYSDAGKLLCKLCHEPVKTESLWDSHIRGANHTKRLQTLQSNEPTPPRNQGNGTGKRKHDDVNESISDAEGEVAEDAIRKKRSKPDMAPVTTNGSGEKRQSPPLLGRRTSNTPIQGVEIAIPSRPATPAGGSNSATSTPKGTFMGRSPLIGSETTNTPTSTSTPTLSNLPISTQSLSIPATTTTAAATSARPQAPTANNAIDEAEWAAFEAEVVNDTTTNTTNGTNGTSYADATISAPALSAAELAAAKSAEEEHERRTRDSLLDAQIADEREDATRALEAEFEEMEELETRVRRLKERREELKKASMVNLRGAAKEGEDMVMAKSPVKGAGKENRGDTINEEDEEDDDDDDEDDWDAFRFR